MTLSGGRRRRVLDLAWLNSHFQAGLRNPLDTAIVDHGPRRDESWIKLDEVPFDFQRRRSSVRSNAKVSRLLITKGATEDSSSSPNRYEEPDVPCAPPCLTTPRGTSFMSFRSARHEGSERSELPGGFRARADRVELADECDLSLLVLSFSVDPPKEGAGMRSQDWTASGVSVKILSGDDERVARHVCSELGIPDRGAVDGCRIEVARTRR